MLAWPGSWEACLAPAYWPVAGGVPSASRGMSSSGGMPIPQAAAGPLLQGHWGSQHRLGVGARRSHQRKQASPGAGLPACLLPYVLLIQDGTNAENMAPAAAGTTRAGSSSSIALPSASCAARPGGCTPPPALGCCAGWAGGPAVCRWLSNLQLLSLGCHSCTAQVQKCSPGRRMGWPQHPGFPSVLALMLGRVPFSRPFPAPGDGSNASVLEVGDWPLLLHILPRVWECRDSAWPVLHLPSEPCWLASTMFVLARRLVCWSQWEDELGTMCLLPPQLRVFP